METPQVVHIKKYPNRRYYEMDRSCHVTLQDMHDMILAGKDLCITDSRNGDDITNVVLTQIILEKDPPKLHLFPSPVLHMMVRSNRQVLRSALERFFGPFLGFMASSQKQYDAYLRKAMQGQMVTPLDWANGMLNAFSTAAASSQEPRPTESAPPDETSPSPDGLDDIRRQIATLQERLDEMTAPDSPNSTA